ncbi:MAG: hypothetical protein ACI8ZO_000421 [Flavobacteriales bacterium]
MKLHRDYKGTFGSENIEVYMRPDYKIEAESKGLIADSDPCYGSHGVCPKINPVSGVVGHFFLFQRDNSKWYIKGWRGYPNRVHYELTKKYSGFIVDYPGNGRYKFNITPTAAEWDTIEGLHDYLDEIIGKPALEYSPANIEFYAPMFPHERAKIKSDSIDEIRNRNNHERIEEAERKSQKYLRFLKEKRKAISEGDSLKKKRSEISLVALKEFP